MSEITIHSGERYECVFLNEPEVNLHIVQAAGSHVKIHVLNIPVDKSIHRNTDISKQSFPKEAKNNIVVEQAGEGCETEIYALAHLRGDEKLTTETHVNHAVGGGKSNQLLKFVLEDETRGRFVGDLKIAPDAQKTEAHQTNRNLVLSENAEMRTQPQLEIYADDVQATHGASTGQLDETALFYMQQRGISKEKARQLLVGAFMKEIVEAIGDRYSATREQLLNAIDGEIE